MSAYSSVLRIVLPFMAINVFNTDEYGVIFSTYSVVFHAVMVTSKFKLP